MADEERKITRISGVCYSSARAEWSATNDRGARVVCERWRRSDGCCFAALLELSGAVERIKMAAVGLLSCKNAEQSTL
jgi:hypothetical protein